MTIVSKHRLRQTVYELAENDDSLIEPPGVATGVVNYLAEHFLKGRISAHYDPESNSLRWEETKQHRMPATLEPDIPTAKKDVELDPNSVRAHNTLGWAYAERGYWDQAIVEYKQAVKLNSNWGLVHKNLGVALGEKGFLDEAILEQKLAIELNPKDGEAHVNLGHVYVSQGLLDKAISEYKLALRLNPTLVFAYEGLGSACAQKGQLGKAIHWFRRVVSLDPDSATSHHNLGHSLRDKGLLDEAISELRLTTVFDPDSAGGHFDLGLAYERKEYWDQAVDEYRRSLELDPNNAATHNNLGVAYVHKDLLTEARTEFESAVKLESSDATAEIAKKNLQTIGNALTRKEEVNLEDESSLIRPDDPDRNRVLYQRMIASCEGFLHWADKYFSEAGFTYLFGSLDTMDHPKIAEIKILTSAKNTDEKLRNLFMDFAKSTKRIGIRSELRIICDRKLEKSIHDRWVLSKNQNFNVPSPDTIARGQWSEIKETKNRPPFNEWWNDSKDIVSDWNTIKKFQEGSTGS